MIPLSIFGTGFLTTLWRGLVTTGGRFAYAVDDGYIHMAMAQNFAERGVWGPSDAGFASASSSPGWTLVLALVHLVVPLRDWFPLVLAGASATAAIVIAEFVLRSHGVAPWLRATSVALAIWFTPVLALVFTGLEHAAQIAANLAFMHVATNVLVSDARKAPPWLFVLAAVVSALRYEGAALILVVAILLMVRGRLRDGLLVLTVGALPILTLGVVSVLNGGFFLPNSIVMKTLVDQNSSPLFLLLVKPVWAMFSTPHVAGLALVGLWAAVAARGKAADFATIFVGVSYFHLALASTGWFYRYEAYLVFLGVVMTALVVHDRIPSTWPSFRSLHAQRIGALLFAGLLLAVPLEVRAEAAHYAIAPAMENIHDQQIQTGLFLRSHYQGRSVILNDIGAPNFYANVACLDLWGIGSNDVAHIWRDGYLDENHTRALALKHNASVAILFERNFEIPTEWTAVGTWTLQRVTIAGGPTVTFFAINPDEVEPLEENLRTFSSRLPDRVIQNGSYLRPP